MNSAIVGYSGFVGSNLVSSHEFTDKYKSSNIADIQGKHYDLVVFAAAKAEKWRINQDPASDLQHISQLEDVLRSFSTDQLVLISTVDVYANPIDVDERTVVKVDGLHAYGRHRYRLEQFALQQHPSVLVMRLPGLFGRGIKKNVIFDLLNENNLSAIHRAGRFQYYALQHLWSDIQTALAHRLNLLNVATEPIRTDEVAKACFGTDFSNEPPESTPGSYDMRSVHANLFGGNDGYLYSKKQVLAELRDFVIEERAAR